MAHELNMIGGKAQMMYAGRTPWHGLGNYVGEEAVTAQEALNATGFNVDITKQPIYLLAPDGTFRHMEGKYGTYRSDGLALGVVGEDYTVVQPREAFSFLDGMVQDGMRYEVAGALKGGNMMWILAKLPGEMQPVKGDLVNKYLLFVDSYDGSTHLMCFWTPIRVVCMNTLRAAIMSKQTQVVDGVKGKKGRGNKTFITQTEIVLKHTASIHERMAQAQRVMRTAITGYDLYEQYLQGVAQMNLSGAQWNEIAGIVLDFDGAKAGAVQELGARKRNQYDRLSYFFEQGTGQDIPGVKGTGWAAINAVTEWMLYDRTTVVYGSKQMTPQQLSTAQQETRFRGTLLDSGFDKTTQVQQYLYQLAA